VNPLTEALLSGYRHDTSLAAVLSAAVADLAAGRADPKELAAGLSGCVTELERRRVQHLAGLRRMGCNNDRLAELTGLPVARIRDLLAPARELWQASPGGQDQHVRMS
jgi:hypothetical protein